MKLYERRMRPIRKVTATNVRNVTGSAFSASNRARLPIKLADRKRRCLSSSKLDILCFFFPLTCINWQYFSGFIDNLRRRNKVRRPGRNQTNQESGSATWMDKQRADNAPGPLLLCSTHHVLVGLRLLPSSSTPATRCH